MPLAQMNGNFGVSEFDENGVKKDAEQYYKEIYKPAGRTDQPGKNRRIY